MQTVGAGNVSHRRSPRVAAARKGRPTLGTVAFLNNAKASYANTNRTANSAATVTTPAFSSDARPAASLIAT